MAKAAVIARSHCAAIKQNNGPPDFRGPARLCSEVVWNFTLPPAAPAPMSTAATPTPVSAAAAPAPVSAGATPTPVPATAAPAPVSAAAAPAPVSAAATPTPVLHLIHGIDDGGSVIDCRTVCRRGRSAGCTGHTDTRGNKHCNQDGSHRCLHLCFRPCALLARHTRNHDERVLR